MSLTVEQKSVYLGILNSTMILRSIGRTFKENGCKIKDFKINVFIELEALIQKMERSKLIDEDIVCSIERISEKFMISFGQAQKATNVLLKYHFYLYEPYLDKNIKKVLHCPLDSVVLKELKKETPLTKIDKKMYLDIQEEISKENETKIDYDMIWDRRYLEGEGLA